MSARANAAAQAGDVRALAALRREGDFGDWVTALSYLMADWPAFNSLMVHVVSSLEEEDAMGVIVRVDWGRFLTEMQARSLSERRAA